MRDPLCLFVVGTAGQPLGVGGTSCPPKGGSPQATGPQGLTPSPPGSPSPQLASCASPGANSEAVRDPVVRTPRPNSVPWAQGSHSTQKVPTHRSTSLDLVLAVLAELQHQDTLCRRPEILVAGRLAHFLPFWRGVIQVSRRIAPDPSVSRNQEHTTPNSQTRHPVQRGGGPDKEGGRKTSSSRPGEERVLQYLFPCQQEKSWPQAHLFSQDFIQDRDSQVCNSGNETTPVDGQCGSEGRLLPHWSSASAPPVPQIPVAKTVLPVQGSALGTVLGPSGLHQYPGPAGGLDQTNGGYSYTRTSTTASFWGSRPEIWSSQSKQPCRCSLEQGSY